MLLSRKFLIQAVLLAVIAAGCVAIALVRHQPLINVAIGLAVGGGVGGGLLFVLRRVQAAAASPGEDEGA